MKTRIRTLLLAFMVFASVCSCQAIIGFADETEPELVGIVVKDEFNTLTTLRNPGGVALSLQEFEERGGALRVLNNGSGPDGSTGRKYLYYPTQAMPEDEKNIAVSFDLMLSDYNYYGQIVVQHDSGARAMMTITKDGFVSCYSGSTYISSTNDALPRFEYTPGEWYTITFGIDREKKQITYYLNGKGFGKSEFSNDWEADTTLRIDSHSAVEGELSEMFLDNIIFGTSDAVIHTVPEVCEIVCDNFGQTYFTQDLDFSISLHNTTDALQQYEIMTVLINDLQITEYSDVQTAEVKPGESKEFTYFVNVKRYGYYDVEVTLTNIRTGEQTIKTTYFSVLKKSEIQNPRMGFADFTATFNEDMDRVEEKMEFFKNIGVSTIRQMAEWRQFELSPGQYAMPDDFKRFYEAAKANNIDIMTTLGMDNPTVTGANQRPPKTPAARSLFADYAYKTVNATKEYSTVYDFWNEFNSTVSNTNGSTADDYVALAREAYPRLKAAYPNAEITGPGSLANTPSDANFLWDWFRNMMEAGANHYMDAISIHPYSIYDPPESNYSVNVLQGLHEIAEEYGIGELPFYATEFGWSASVVPYETMSKWAVRYAVMSHELLDCIYWHCAREGSPNLSKGSRALSEVLFGWMCGDNEYLYEVPNAPHETYLAMSNYNNLLADADFMGQVETDSDAEFVYRYKTRSGKDLLVVWNKDDVESDARFALNVDNVEVCDLYGNTEVIHTKNGELYLHVTDSPQYIIGTFSDFTVDTSEFKLNKAEIEIVPGDRAEFKINADSAFGDAIYPVFETSDNIQVANKVIFENSTATVTLTAGNDSREGERIKISLYDKATNALVYIDYLDVIYRNCVSTVFSPYLDAGGRWKAQIRLVNNGITAALSGTVAITEPAEIAQKSQSVRFENLAPTSSDVVQFFLPEEIVDTRMNVKYKVTLDAGQEFEAEDEMNLTGIEMTNKPPKIDGILNEGEWDTGRPILLNSAEQVKLITDWNGVDDLSAEIYMNADKENFYIAAKVKDNVHIDDAKNAIWQNDSLQFAFASKRELGGLRTEYAIGMADGEPVHERYSFMAVDTGITDQRDGLDYSGIEKAVTRDEKNRITYYEAKFPWTQIYGRTGLTLTDNNETFMSLLINDNDGGGRRGWLEYCGGIGSQKDVLQFVKIKLVN